MNKPLIVALALCLGPALPAPAGEDDTASRIVGAALTESRAWDKLEHLTDRIGHRLSGSEALERAIAWAEAGLREDGADRVWTEKVMVPHWVRGDEATRIVSPVQMEMATSTLGGSVGTPEGGVTAEVIEITSMEELDALGEAVRGKIVLVNRPIVPDGGPETGYGAGSALRAHVPSKAGKLGAVGMLIRSLGTADYRLPHTGALHYTEEDPRIPSAAIAAEDAELIHRLIASGDTVRVQMELGARTFPDAESANVLADIRGREKPEEIVLIGAHIDSWDVGSGAHDDGVGCVTVMEAMRILKSLGLTPRRTVRAVLFTNEENGLRGGRQYEENHREEMQRHVAAIESDAGGGRPMGFGVTAGPGAVETVAGMIRPLAAIDADEVTGPGGGADISPMKKHGVPQIGLRPDTTRYFDYHHTEADTLDKIDRGHLDRAVAAMALLAWSLAESDENLPRVPLEEPETP